jgi:hypothetical protein
VKVHATPGDTYMFTGTPVITYITDCADCDKPWQTPLREFTTAEAQDVWATAHGNTGHHVTRSTWVVGR